MILPPFPVARPFPVDEAPVVDVEVVIRPKLALEMFKFAVIGAAKRTLFVTLNASARISIRWFSVTLNCREIVWSHSQKPGPFKDPMATFP